MLSRANLFSSSDSNPPSDSPKAIRSFINIARSLTRSLARYALMKSFIIFVINKIDRNENLGISLVKAGLYYRVKS